MNRRLGLSLTLGVVALTVGCNSDGGIGTDPDGNAITFAFASPKGGGASAASFATSGAADETFTDGQNNTLVISKVEVVLGQLELERTDFVDCEANPDATTCGDFKVGPLLIEVPLGSIAREFTVEVDPGEYNGLEIQVHRLNGNDPDDAAIVTDRPDMDGQSIRIEGTYNGEPFTFFSDLDAYFGYDIIPPIVIDETNPSTNVTFSFDLDSFFRDQQGTLVNPNDANAGGEFEQLVETNIQTAIQCFEDENEDGTAG